MKPGAIQYEMVIENLRAQALIEVNVRPDFAKVEMQQHRRRIEAIETIARLNSARAINMVSVATPVKELFLPHSKQNLSSRKKSTQHNPNQELLNQKATTDAGLLVSETHSEVSDLFNHN